MPKRQVASKSVRNSNFFQDTANNDDEIIITKVIPGFPSSRPSQSSEPMTSSRPRKSSEPSTSSSPSQSSEQSERGTASARISIIESMVDRCLARLKCHGEKKLLVKTTPEKPSKSLKRKRNNECAICLNEYNAHENKPEININCGHSYCSVCWDSLMTKGTNYNCPTCRLAVTGRRIVYQLLD